MEGLKLQEWIEREDMACCRTVGKPDGRIETPILHQ